MGCLCFARMVSGAGFDRYKTRIRLTDDTTALSPPPDLGSLP